MRSSHNGWDAASPIDTSLPSHPSPSLPPSLSTFPLPLPLSLPPSLQVRGSDASNLALTRPAQAFLWSHQFPASCDGRRLLVVSWRPMMHGIGSQVRVGGGGGGEGGRRRKEQSMRCRLCLLVRYAWQLGSADGETGNELRCTRQWCASSERSCHALGSSEDSSVRSTESNVWGGYYHGATMPCQALPCCTVLYYAVLCCALLCRA